MVMDKVEAHVMRWVPSEWQSSNASGEWDRTCHALYGAIQASIQVGAHDDYEAYACLADVARQHRLDSVGNRFKVAA